METITLPREVFFKMRRQLELLRSSKLYRRLLEFENNIIKGKKYTREDLGF